MGTTATTAAWFLIAVIPITIFVSFSDMKRMKIPNVAVYSLLAAYAVLGLITLPFSEYLWRWSHFAIVLAACMLLWAGRVLGGGDAKFLAAAAPMVSLQDIRLIILLLSATLLAGWATHRLVKISPLRKKLDDWASWETGKRFPMGFPLSVTLLLYLLLALFYG